MSRCDSFISRSLSRLDVLRAVQQPLVQRPRALALAVGDLGVDERLPELSRGWEREREDRTESCVRRAPTPH